MSEKSVPHGYMADPQGRLVPIEAIKPIDLERDALVREIVANAKKLNGAIADFKAETFGNVAAFVQLSAEQYGAKIGGDKGNVTLVTYDGAYKVQRAIAETLAFDERLQAAKSLIDECIHRWAEGSSKEIRALINDAFQVDAAGKINTGRVLGLRRLDITDEAWQRAMTAISDAVQVTGSKTYVRVYERVGDTDQYRPIPLDVAAA
jgi:hypothetical protein